MGISLFDVRVQYRKHSSMIAFGPFDNPEDAKRCLVVLAGRADVLTAIIEPHVKTQIELPDPERPDEPEYP